MDQSVTFTSDINKELSDVALMVSKESLFTDHEGICSRTDITLYSRRMFFWSAPESDENLIADCIYEKNPEVKIKCFMPVSDKYDVAFLAVINACSENMENEELWDIIPRNLCIKIKDLMEYYGDSIAQNSLLEGDMILWSNLNPLR